MITHPARHYIYYLISKRNYRAADIINRLQELELALPEQTAFLEGLAREILAAQKKVVAPSGLTRNLESREARGFFDTWRIGDFWRGTPEVKAARRLLTDNAEVKRTLEIMLLGPISPHDIAMRLQRRYGMTPKEVSAGIVRVYAHYFWNIGCLSRKKWISLINVWAGEEDRTAYLAALQAPRSSSGVTTTLMYAERTEDEIDPINTYTTVRNLAFKQFMEVALTAHPRTSLLAKTQASMLALQTMRAAEEELVRLRGVSNNAFLEQLSRFEHKLDHALPVSASAFLAADNLSESPHGQNVDATAIETTLAEEE